MQVYNKRRLRATKTDDVNRFAAIIQGAGQYTILDRLPSLLTISGSMGEGSKQSRILRQDPGLVGNKALAFGSFAFYPVRVPRVKSHRLFHPAAFSFMCHGGSSSNLDSLRLYLYSLCFANPSLPKNVQRP